MSSTRRVGPIHSAAQFKRLSLRSRQADLNSLEVLSRMRRTDESLTHTARAVGVDPTTVRRYVGKALVRHGRRWVPSPSDRLYRPVQFLTPRGLMTLDTTDARTASRISDYWNAVHRFWNTGNTDALRPFRRKAVRVGKVAHPFITDPRTLARLGYAGEVQFEDLYGPTA